MGRAADEPRTCWCSRTISWSSFRGSVPSRNAATSSGCASGPATTSATSGPYETVLARPPFRRAPRVERCGARHARRRSQRGDHGLPVASDRGVERGAPSATRASSTSGKVRTAPLHARPKDDLSGYCHDCYYAEECRAAAPGRASSRSTARVTTPFCHHRAPEIQRQGKREHVVRVEAPEGRRSTTARSRYASKTSPSKVCEAEHAG
jgi:hypothetical protein